MLAGTDRGKLTTKSEAMLVFLVETMRRTLMPASSKPIYRSALEKIWELGPL